MESLRVIGLSMLLLGANVALYGQQIRGSIVGNVTDASGSAVPEAQITVKNEGTGIEFKTRTDAFGTYTVPDLLAGLYTVVAAKEGFKTFQATGVRLLSAQTARQDVALQVGPVQQTVNVVAQPQLVQTDSPTIGGTLQTLELANLPFLTTWGSITNTSIEGGRANPATGVRGDWSGTVFQPIYETACGMDEERAGMFYGNVWKKVIIGRPERWIGIRSDPTFPQRGISLGGKTYFLDTT